MVDLEKLRVFHYVARCGSITGAAAQLGLSQPAISRQISTLEGMLGISLFHRHARGLTLTEQGVILLQSVQEALSALIMAEAILSEDMQAQGPLRVACNDSFSAMWLTGQIGKFLELFPNIRLSILLMGHNDVLDLTLREADVAILSAVPPQARLISIPFMTSAPRVYASQRYVSEFGVPNTFQDLDQHRIVTLNENVLLPHNWLLTAGGVPGKQRAPFLTFGSAYGLIEAVAQGIGIGALHPYVVTDLDLVEVLPHDRQYAPHIQSLLVYPVPIRHSKRVAAFRNFLFKAVLQP